MPGSSRCSWKAQHNRTDDPLGADAAKLPGTDEVKVYEEKVYITVITRQTMIWRRT